MSNSKTCTRCSILKDLSEFFRDAAFKDGRASLCKVCKNAATAVWREKNRDKYNSSMRAYTKKHRRRIHLDRAYGMSVDKYNEILLAQGARCKICEKQNMSQKRPLVVDYNHKTGKVRGLLCYGCNRALHTLESPGLLQRAMDYLLSSN